MKLFTLCISVVLFAFSTAAAAPSVSINGLPSTLAVGDTIVISASGGSAPYSWSSNYPAVTVTQLNATDAEVIVLQPALNVSITATDQLAEFITQVVSAFPYASRIAPVTFIDGDTAIVPILYSNYHGPLSFFSADISIPFDTTLFTFVGTDNSGTLTSGMSVAWNTVYDTAKIGIATSTPFNVVPEQLFLKLKFVSKNTVVTPQTDLLMFTRFLVNETVHGSHSPGLLTVNPIPNFPPVFGYAPADTAMDEGDVYARTVSASDANGHAVHFFLTMNPAGAMAILDSLTGSFTFSPTMMSAGSYLFEITANDGNGGMTQHQFTVTVDNVNQLPYFNSAFPDSFIVVEGKPFVYYATGQDPDLSPVNFSLVSPPSGMTIDTATAKIEWTPSFTQTGTYLVDVNVNDVSGATVTQQAKFFVADSNRAPVFTAVPNDTMIFELAPYTALFTAADPDFDAVRYFVQSGAPSGFLLDSLTGTISYTPSQFDSGMYSISLVATDHRAFGDVYHTFQLQVKNQNQSPILVQDFPDTVYIMENQPYSRTFSAIDPDADSLHFTLTNGPSGMMIDPVTGLLDWTPGYSQAGLYTVTVNVTDTIGAFSKDSLVFAVFNVNRSPYFTSVIPDTVFLQEGKNFLLDIDAADDDVEPLRYSISFTPSGMTFDTANGMLSWTPAYWQAGDYGFVFQVYDTSGANEFRSVLFTVIDSNQVPVFSMVPNDTSISEGQTYNAMIIATDPDSDPMKYYVQSGLPAGFQLDSTSGFISWTPDSLQQGSYPITLLATDKRPHGSITHSFIVTVDNVNLAPVITTPFPDTLFFVEGQNYSFSYSAFDGDGDPIEYYLFNPPSGMTVDSLTGDVDWTPTYEQAGNYNPYFKAKDPSGAYGSMGVVIIVLNMNRLPVFTATLNDTTISENQILQFTYSASDIDLDSLSFNLMRPIPGMSLTTHGLLEWTPNFAQAGVETVIVMVTDYSSVLFDTAVVTILNMNNPPVFIAPLKDTAIARFDTLRFQYNGFDPDAQPVTYSIVNGPGGATMSPSGYLEWAPPVNSNGVYTFVVQISDSTLMTNDSLRVKVVRLGDVSANGSISSFDAGLILREQVGAVTLQPLQERVGDVSGDTTLSSSDASFILQYVVGLISNFPSGLGKRSQSEAVMSAFAFRIVPTQNEDEYELLVSVNKPSNVYGITMSLAFDSSIVVPKTLKGTTLTDSMMVASFFPKERANLALAGTTPLNTAGDIARFTFTLRRKDLSANAVLFTMKKFVLNEKDYANDIAGITLSVKPAAALPTVYAMEQNYPNPFNPSTTIKYQMPEAGRVSITVYNMLGQMVKQLVDTEREAGYHTIVWNGTDRNNAMVSSGVYLYKITAQSNGKNAFTSTKKMLFLK
jgi:hypothetical protein